MFTKKKKERKELNMFTRKKKIVLLKRKQMNSNIHFELNYTFHFFFLKSKRNFKLVNAFHY